MDPLRKLCCGNATSEGRLNDVLSILGNVITRYGAKSLSVIKGGSDEDKVTYGCFIARKLLESASSAILARMDPSRFLILQEYQQRAGAGYKAHERHPASIAWSGDIIPDKASNAVWSTESTPDKFVRALLGGHLAEVAWPKAIERFALDQSEKPRGLWFEELSSIYEAKSQQADAKPTDEPRVEEGASPLARPNPSATSSVSVGALVLGVLRARTQDNYSALSKGVHLEFVVDETVVLDPATVVEHMLTAVKIVALLGYLSNYMDSVFTCIDRQIAAELLLNVEESFSE